MALKKWNNSLREIIRNVFEDSGNELEPSDSEVSEDRLTTISTSAPTPIPSRVGSPYLVPGRQFTNLDQCEYEYLAREDTDLFSQIQNFEAAVTFQNSPFTYLT